VNCLIVDDNQIARTTLRQLASGINDLFIAGECADAMEAYNFLQDEPIDVILLDIEMPGMSGLELTRILGEKRPIIIFTTSKKDYAVEAFDLNVVDYLVKPITHARFIQAIDKGREVLQSQSEEVKLNEDEFIFIRDSNVVKRLSLDDILYAEAMGDYVKLHAGFLLYTLHCGHWNSDYRLQNFYVCTVPTW
jgi:DNA-binding LytR/AlgR family response regulator